LVNARLLVIVVAELVLVLLGVYGYTSTYAPALSASLAATEPVTLTGAGATLSYPLLSSVAQNYQQSHPGTAVNYQPLGSIAGISQLTAKTIDFCVTYPPMTQAQRNKAPGLPLHIPESISAVVVAYNLPGLTSTLRLTGNVTADIFLGKVNTWTDPEITDLNRGLNLPDKPINTWHMAEAEGTTFVFTSYLAKVSPAFRQSLGSGTSVSWTIGLSVPTDAGVANLMQSTPYSIGYMELSYAIQSNLSYATLQNSAGKWIVPSLQSAQAALQLLPQGLPATSQDWSGVNLLDEPSSDAYPLVTFTYLIILQNLSLLPAMDTAKAKALVDFIWYLVHDGQSLGTSLGYVPLPANVVAIDEAGLKSVVFQGQTLI
jgi:phosphate transport system substrate-binding protein